MKYDKNFYLALEYTFKSEGGYVNNKNDRGGPTNMGITQDTYDSWNKRHNIPKKDVKNITREEATDIYYHDYWIGSGANKIDDIGMAYLVFDTEVHGGHGTNSKIRKRGGDNADSYLKAKWDYHTKDIKNDPRQIGHKEGWAKRIEEAQRNVGEIRLKKELLEKFPTKYSGDNAIEKMDNKVFRRNEESINKELQTRFEMLNEYNKKIKESNEKSAKNSITGYAAPVTNTNKSTSNSQNNSSSSSKHINFNGISKDGIPWKNWSENEQRGFLEGFIGKSLDTADKNKKGSWTDKFNIGNPDKDKGHWVTLDNGKHLFIKDK